MNNLSFFSVFGSTAPVIYLLVILDLILKGITLYKSARRDQKVWFLALLLVNSLGILPVIYMIINKDIQPITKSKSKPAKKAKR